VSRRLSPERIAGLVEGAASVAGHVELSGLLRSTVEIAMELTGANGGPVQISETERAAKVASLLAVAQARKAGDVSDLV
jgi:hypothetical protein